jgi:hypothetical protein
MSAFRMIESDDFLLADDLENAVAASESARALLAAARQTVAAMPG